MLVVALVTALMAWNQFFFAITISSQQDRRLIRPAQGRNGRLAIDSGLVDLVSIENPKFLFLDPMLRAGVLSPLDAYGEQYGWADVMVPAALKRSSRSGQLWTLPLYYELCGVAYRKSVLDSVGGAVPSSWEEFVALLTAFQEQGLIPLTVGDRGFSQVQMLHNQLWGSIGGPDGIGTLIFGRWEMDR